MVSSQIELSEKKVKYDTKIEDLLKTQPTVFVNINLRANIISNYSNSIKSPEHQFYVKDVQMQIDRVQNEVIPYLSNDEFSLRRASESFPSFDGNITKKGFEKLLKDPRIESITLVKETHVSGLDASFMGDGNKVLFLVLVAFFIVFLVLIFLVLKKGKIGDKK